MKTFFTVAVVVFLVLSLGCVYFAVAQTPPLTEKIGDLMVTFNDSTKRNEFFTIYNQQGCPPNIYLHDTMWQWGTGGYHNTPDPNPLPPVFIHDTLYLPGTTPPIVPSLVTIFTTQVPPTTSESDGQPITLGVKFRSSQTAYVKGIRFAKAKVNTGQHIGYLYSLQGAILDSGVFVAEKDSGWQTLTLTKNIQLTANTTYIAAYYSPTGQYSSTNNAFNTSITNGIITGLASGTVGVNGVYSYGRKFPTQTYLNSNYWVTPVISETK